MISMLQPPFPRFWSKLDERTRERKKTQLSRTGTSAFRSWFHPSSTLHGRLAASFHEPCRCKILHWTSGNEDETVPLTSAAYYSLDGFNATAAKG
ncbi:MAG: hypothetical protein E6230_16465 [Paenibacillus dendritiformis]|uniref:hypothetical protein n=1 Tax=uncultured Paenibacillus sp. TaxID=227322 RepID=UPI0025F4D4C6|nr:hypothetical protein [uncultured Paenibacillus sp.]MDU5143768.1 hypothetical protein [Paenibacillus dendritiformis]